MSNTYFTVEQLTHYLHFSKSKIYSLISEGKIPHCKVSKQILFIREEIDLWVKGQRVVELSPEDMPREVKVICDTIRYNFKVLADMMDQEKSGLKPREEHTEESDVTRTANLIKEVLSMVATCEQARIIYSKTRGPESTSVKAIEKILSEAWNSIRRVSEPDLKKSLIDLKHVHKVAGDLV